MIAVPVFSIFVGDRDITFYTLRRLLGVPLRVGPDLQGDLLFLEAAMKAIVRDTYGSPDVLRVEEVDKPVPADGQVLIQVRAASVNPIDVHFLTGSPFLARLLEGGVLRPSKTVLGTDVAGIVEAVGDHVTTLKPGDEVFGISYGCGAFAEYLCMSEERLVLAPKPAEIGFEEAACTPGAAYVALHCLTTAGQLKPDQKVLINGASGGIGTFAVQIARWIGAEVTAVCSTDNLEMVSELGAKHVMDYTQHDFTKSNEEYDLVFDVAAKKTFAQCRPVMAQRGAYLTTAISPGLAIQGLFSKLGKQRLLVLAPPKLDQQTLRAVAELLEDGTIKPAISERYPLTQVPDALRRMETGHTRGKLAIVP